MFGWFRNKKEVEELKNETKKSFDSVKKDILSLSEWIKYLKNEKENQKNDLEEIKKILSTVNSEIDELKNIISIMNEVKSKQVFKTPKEILNKQTAVYPVQTAVQTAVQTPNLDYFSITERAILWVLMNSDLKLSYEDLAVVLGKSRATIRGQINVIKSKSEGIIEEIVEKNGKKRVYIPVHIKEKLLKKTKVRVVDKRLSKKSKKISEY